VSGRRARRWALAAILCGLLLSAAACGGMPVGGLRAPTIPGGVVKVALVDALTGPLASTGIAVRNSVSVAVDELNAGGGVLGVRVEMMAVDDQGGPDRTALATRQALADPAVRLLVGPSYAGLFLAARPAVAQAGMANCVAMMEADDLINGAPFSFRTQEPTAARIPALLTYMQRGASVKKLGLVIDEGISGRDYDQQLTDLAAKYGVQYVGAAFAANASDQRPLVQQLLQRGADALVLSDNQATAGRTLLALKQLNAIGRVRTFGFSGLGAYSFPQQVGDLAAGLTFASTVQTYLSDLPQGRWPPAYRDFVTRIQTRFGPAENGVEMRGRPAAAACITEWARAVRAANDFDGARVARAWERLDVPAAESVLGARERFSPTDHNAVAEDGLFVYQWARTGTRWGLKQLAGPGGPT
jgi:branched-chain amino acid transport system substrate-binding protein